MDRKAIAKKAIYVIAALQFVFITYTNLFCIETTMDNDVAKLFLHIIEMWNSKQLLIDGWVNMTTLEIDCAGLVALPIYGICKNIYISFGLANIIIALAYAAIVVKLFKRMNIDKAYGILTAFMLIIPYSFGQLCYYNMMFFAGGQYSIKVIVPLILLCLLTDEQVFRNGCDDKVQIDNKKVIIWWIVAVISWILCGLCGLSSGPYVLVSGVAPIAIAYFVIVFLEKDKLLSNLICKANILLGGAVAASVVGVGLCKIYDIGTTSMGVVTLSAYAFPNNLLTFISAFMENFGAFPYYDIDTVSIFGIACALRFVLSVFMIIVLAAACKKAGSYFAKEEKEYTVNEYTTFGLIAIILVDVFVTLATGMCQPRYLLVGTVPLIILAGIWIADRNIDKFRLRICALAAIALLAILSDYLVLTNENWPKTSNENSKFKAVIEKVHQFDEDTVIVMDDHGISEMLRTMDYGNGRLYITYLTEGDDYLDSGLGVYDYYSQVVDNSLLERPHLMLVSEYVTNLDQFSEEKAETYELVDEYQNYKIYRYIQ